MAEEAEARRAMVFMNFIVVLNCCLMIDDLLYLASRWFIVGLTDREMLNEKEVFNGASFLPYISDGDVDQRTRSN